MSLGVFLKESRKSVDLTQEEMAHLAHFSRPTISKLESGDRSLKVDDLLRWLQVIKARLPVSSIQVSPSTTTLEVGVALINGVDITLLADMLTKVVGGYIHLLGGFI